MAGAPQTIRPHHPQGRSLVELATFLGVTPDVQAGAVVSGVVTGVVAASSEAQPGDVFFALPGAHAHGATYARNAVNAGAVAIVTDEEGSRLLTHGHAGFEVPILIVQEPRNILGVTSAWVYGTDVDEVDVFGVTGTNGKTSTVFMVAAILEQMGIKTGLSSTSIRRIGPEVVDSVLTTPEANHLHAMIARMNEVDVRAAVIEVSAHALSRHRVDGVVFDVVGFTNFSQDHLDDYGTMDAYFAAKAELFTPAHARHGVVVANDEWSDRLIRQSLIPVSTIGLDQSKDVDWRVKVTHRGIESTTFTLISPEGDSLTSTVPLVGDFSAVNASLAIVMIVEAGFDFALVKRALTRDGRVNVYVPGRTERVSGDRGPLFYVDYGHTPQAFAATLEALRQVTPGKLTMIFGADGDRDTTKRADMGAIAARGSDALIITDYHPRTEDPAHIRAQLLAGARGARANCVISEIADPGQAVREAIAGSRQGDTILYAGPGDEDFRDLGTHRVPYSAREDARAALHVAGW